MGLKFIEKITSAKTTNINVLNVDCSKYNCKFVAVCCTVIEFFVTYINNS